MRNALLHGLILGLLGACASQDSPGPSRAQVAPVPADAVVVGPTTLERAPASSRAPDIGIQVFTSASTPQTGTAPAFPTVRKAETLLLPSLLARTLQAGGAFGVVRVVPDDNQRLPLLVSGEILASEPALLDLRITLRGADERVLFQQRYRDTANPEDYPARTGAEPFGDLYRRVANDLHDVVAQMTEAELTVLSRLALLRFGAGLAPASFASYITEADDGEVTLIAYPAEDDPMLARLRRLRRQDDLFVDAVDEQYGDLLDSVGESYDLWRSYVFELENYGAAYRESAAQRGSDARRGSFASMQQVYATFRKVKLQEEDLRDVVSGFDGEALDTIMEVDDGVFRLSGSVEERYRQWRDILTRIYRLESGLPEPAPGS
ncbi:MAG: hypothetical protein AAF933_13200 [Pseudomonadota bacterium]